MTVFKLVRFSRLLKMNWHFVAKAILGKNAPSLWIIFVTYRVRITTSPLKFGGFFMSPHFLNFPCTSQRLRRASAGVRGSDAMEHAFRQGQQIFQQQTGNFVGEPLKSQQSLGQEAGGDVIIYICRILELHVDRWMIQPELDKNTIFPRAGPGFLKFRIANDHGFGGDAQREGPSNS